MTVETAVTDETAMTVETTATDETAVTGGDSSDRRDSE